MIKRTWLAGIVSTVIFGFVTLALGAQPAIASPPTVTVGHVNYSYDPSHPELGATIIGEDGSLGDTLSPPESITVSTVQYAVVAIADYAFHDNVALRHVTMPASIRQIGIHAFSQTTSGGITDIQLNDGLVTIGSSAFFRTSLSVLDIPDSVTTLGYCVACSIPSLTDLFISQSLTAIPDSAFMYNTALTYVEIPGSVTTIGNSAFYLDPLEGLYIPGNVVSIGSMAFALSVSPVIFDGAPPAVDSQYPPFSSGVQVNFTCPYASAIVAGQWNGYPAEAYCAVTLHAWPGVSVPFVQTTYGGHVTAPPTPTYSGYDFAGWFTDNSLTTPFDFSAALYSDQQAFAKWVPASSVPTAEPSALAHTGSNVPSAVAGSLALFIVGVMLFILNRKNNAQQRQKMK